MKLQVMKVRAGALRILFLSMTALFVGAASATEILDQREVPGGHERTGSIAVISLDPVLPRVGEPFTISITGQWQSPCIPEQAALRADYAGQTIQITSNSVVDGQNCGDGGVFQLTPYSLSVSVPSSAWESFDENQPLDIVFRDAHRFLSFSRWRRTFDLRWGLHEIPPRLGAGFWLSEETPFQGLLLQQQESTLVFYELKYDRQNGAPNWHMADARFHGNSANGVAYLVNWLQPVDGHLDMTPEIPFRHLPQPEAEDMLFEASSAGVAVEGVNRIKVFVGKTEAHYPISHYYKRWVFALGDQQLPTVVPDMSGAWNLYGFDGQQLKQSFELEFKSGSRLDNGAYRFSSIDDNWTVDCTVNLDGEGACRLQSAVLGLKMNYDLLEFNGNFVKGSLNNTQVTAPNQTGILLRATYQLPVLDLQ